MTKSDAKKLDSENQRIYNRAKNAKKTEQERPKQAKPPKSELGNAFEHLDACKQTLTEMLTATIEDAAGDPDAICRELSRFRALSSAIETTAALAKLAKVLDEAINGDSGNVLEVILDGIPEEFCR